MKEIAQCHKNNEGNRLYSARKNKNTWHSFTFFDKDTEKN